MEAEDASSSSWWSAKTNWSICSGSIVNSVTVESSDISLNIEEPAVVSPVFLRPPPSGSAPCEIEITFEKKYELRQVYVRSSARVYEIYYAPNTRSGNDYLCTVRCSVSDTASVDEPLPMSERTDGERSGEDDWLEVKVVNPPKGTIRKGNLYEATAEISDSEPCVSVTLRLLSLEENGCVFVDEVYIFADPVDSTDSESRSSEAENASGNSFMAMLSPVLLQLSKAGVNRKQDSSIEVQRENTLVDIASSQRDQVSTVNDHQLDECASDRHESKVLETNVAASEPVQLCTATGVSDAGSQPNNVAKEFDIERVLGQLIERVGNLESVFLRFEEKMLKPISSIDSRLQRVEEQLEAISKNSQYASFPDCTRFSAPVFSCDESCVNSFHQDGRDNPNPSSGIIVGLDKIDDVHTHSLSDEGADENAAQLVPSLVVTAPDFANCDEEDLDAGESPRDTIVKPPNMSIDEALASALAGFLSSAHSNTLTQTLSMKVPEFSQDEDGDRHVTDSPITQEEGISSSFIVDEKPDGTECARGSVSTSSFSSESRINMLGYLVDDFYGPDPRKSDVQINGGFIESAECNVGGTVISTATEDTTVQSKILLEQALSLEEVDNLKSLEIRTVDRVDIANEATDVTQASVEDVLNFSRVPWEVNFEMPILDVSFVSQGTSNPSTKSAMEALLCDVKSETEVSKLEKSNVMSVSQEASTFSINSSPIEALLCDISDTGACTVEKTNLLFAPEEASIKTSALFDSPENSSSNLSPIEASVCVVVESNYVVSNIEEAICSQEASIKSSSELEALP